MVNKTVHGDSYEYEYKYETQTTSGRDIRTPFERRYGSSTQFTACSRHRYMAPHAHARMRNVLWRDHIPLQNSGRRHMHNPRSWLVTKRRYKSSLSHPLDSDSANGKEFVCYGLSNSQWRPCIYSNTPRTA